MRKVLIALLVATLAVAACGGDDDNEPQAGEDSAPGVEGTDGEPPIQDEFIVVDGQQTEIVESCVDTSGQYTGNLPEGGLFILRGGTAPDENFVDYLPSQDADPLSSQKPEDTTVTSEGSFVTGDSTVYTEDGANSLEIQFGIIIEDTEQSC
jgi:hypothetical protein